MRTGFHQVVVGAIGSVLTFITAHASVIASLVPATISSAYLIWKWRAEARDRAEGRRHDRRRRRFE